MTAARSSRQRYRVFIEDYKEGPARRLDRRRNRQEGVERADQPRQAARVLLLEDGRVIERGTHDELMSSRGVYYEMVVRQMETSGQPAEAVLR
jgi:hypothetical protein